MKKLTLILVPILAFTLWGVRADGMILASDHPPAASLLLPYFEVDLGNPAGQTTLFSINNSSASAILAHVTLWTDLGIPTFAFNVYLTGYDVQTVNLRDIFNGVLPRTASAGQDPTDTISPKGQFSQDINFASCTGQLPPAPLPQNVIDHLRAAHTGQASALYGGLCTGQALGDNFARGYATVDTVYNCTTRLPPDAGYFGSGGSGDVTNQNVMWGDYFYVHSDQNYAEGDTLVAIEASATNPETSVSGQYTFYGRNTGWTAADNREPLGSKFATRFLKGGAFNGGTKLIVWRDSKVAVSGPNYGAFTCPAVLGVRPDWYPLDQEDAIAFDEQEQPIEFAANILPASANSIQIDTATYSLVLPYAFGWIYLDLNHSNAAAGANPPEDPAAAQAWGSAVMSASGRFSVGQSAIVLENAGSTTHNCLGGGSPPCH